MKSARWVLQPECAQGAGGPRKCGWLQERVLGTWGALGTWGSVALHPGFSAPHQPAWIELPLWAVLGTGHPRCPEQARQVHGLQGNLPDATFLLRTVVSPVQCLFPVQPRGTRGDMSHFLDSDLSQLLSHFGLGLS